MIDPEKADKQQKKIGVQFAGRVQDTGKSFMLSW